MLAAVGVEVMRISCLMNLWRARMLELLGSEREVIPIIAVEPEEFAFNGNLDSKL